MRRSERYVIPRDSMGWPLAASLPLFAVKVAFVHAEYEKDFEIEHAHSHFLREGGRYHQSADGLGDFWYVPANTPFLPFKQWHRVRPYGDLVSMRSKVIQGRRTEIAKPFDDKSALANIGLLAVREQDLVG